MNICAKTDACNSVQFVAHVRSGSEPLHQCKLSKEGGFSSGVCGATDMHNYAYLIDPPVVESPDSATILCSTECPFANGQQYTTVVGEAFHIDCGSRHGTKPIYKDRKSSLKDCMDACGKLLPCHSVDYDKYRKVCYYSNHHGEPTVPAPGFDSAHSMGCSGACERSGCGFKSKQLDDSQVTPQDTSPFPQDGPLAISEPPESLCPGLHGKTETVNGINYQMYCGIATGCPLSDDLITPYPIKSLQECLDGCSINPACRSINFLNTDLNNGNIGQCNMRKCNLTPSITGNHIAGLRV